jgi:hypothetical protein
MTTTSARLLGPVTLVLALSCAGVSTLQAQVSLGNLRSAVQGSPDSNLTSDQASGGLKEALSRGVATAVASTGHPGGYFENAAIKILMPPKLQPVEKGLRGIGMGPKVDEFVKSMNAAAEEAAPEAKAILLQALKSMTITDAKGIVMGDKTAGTEYFKRTTTTEIQAAFRPIVEKAMAKTGVHEQFTELMGKAPALPFMKTPTLDINQYVLDKATDGLFVVMGEEEAKIRTDPAAQVTPLLKTVFGRH